MASSRHETQHRLIVGAGKTERHFILADENTRNVWAIPGCIRIGTEVISGAEVGVYLPRTATTNQIRIWAARKKMSTRIIEKYPIIRLEQKSSAAKF